MSPERPSRRNVPRRTLGLKPPPSTGLSGGRLDPAKAPPTGFEKDWVLSQNVVNLQ
ncbi:MAG: hypothetical protein SRB2_02718 [Desulfobacteraceae bacterium Eth-SRB2]|nr:MAG: hypothetical protein SRB2_02718 [Desulfobacteraceae bacterium Eth-SRB2]